MAALPVWGPRVLTNDHKRSRLVVEQTVADRTLSLRFFSNHANIRPIFARKMATQSGRRSRRVSSFFTILLLGLTGSYSVESSIATPVPTHSFPVSAPLSELSYLAQTIGKHVARVRGLTVPRVLGSLSAKSEVVMGWFVGGNL